MFAAKNELLTRPNGGYKLTRSLRFRSSASAYLNRTPASASNRTTWSWSGWVKRGKLGAYQTLFSTYGNSTNVDEQIRLYNSDVLNIEYYSTSSFVYQLLTTQVFRDPAAWYHIVVAMDTTQATASNRIKIYVNGTQVTSFSTATYPAQNTNTLVDGALPHYIGVDANNGLNSYYDGYMAEVNFIDGQALTPSSFGAFSIYNQWLPKKYSGTYGTNGFYLPFTNNASAATLGNDFSGNSNTWTTNNISVTAGSTYDSMTDVPTLTSATAANYPTLNPILLGRSDGGGGWGAKDGNLTGANANAAGGWGMMGTTMAIPSGAGKYYFECTVGASGQSMSVGLQKVNTPFAAPYIVGYTGDANGYSYDNSGLKWNNGSTAYGSAASAGDVIGVAVDASGGTSSITFYKNNVSMGTAFTGITGDLLPAMSSTSGAGMCSINFGQRPFTYTPPSGYLALNTFNL